MAFWIASVLAQTSGHQLVSDLDQSLSIQRIGVLELRDNTSQIYAKPGTLRLMQLLETDRRFDAVLLKDNSSIEELEDQPQKVLALMRESKAQGLLGGRISKGPQGLGIRLVLFSAPQGKLLLQESSPEENLFEVSDFLKKLDLSFARLLESLPFQGMVLSRRGNVVTLNLGSRHGVRAQDELAVVQIFKLNRHPRFNFVVGSEQNVLGKIIVTKAEESLSFGLISSEKEAGSVRVLSKIVTTQLKQVYQPRFDPNGQFISKKEEPIAFGPAAKEWKPVEKPAFGQIGLLFGLGSHSINNTLDIGTSNANQSMTPAVQLDTEMWLNPNWILDFNLKQSIFRISNSYPGESSPSRLNVSYQAWNLMGSYHFLLHEEFFGPRMSLSLGLSRASTMVDNSVPTAFTSTVYTSTVLGIGGRVPFELESGRKLSVGGELLYYWRPSMNESPVYSGEVSNNQVSSFSGFLVYHLSPRLGVKGQLSFEAFSSSLNNSGDRSNSASSISQNLSFFFGGIEYSF